MKTTEYLDKCKEKLLITSTYQLSKKTGISEQALSRYYSGKRIPDEFTCFKIAETLKMDPAFIIASIKAETEKDVTKKDYFKSFSGASRKIVANTVAAVLVSFIFLIASITQNDSNAVGRVFLRKRYFA